MYSNFNLLKCSTTWDAIEQPICKFDTLVPPLPFATVLDIDSELSIAMIVGIILNIFFSS